MADCAQRFKALFNVSCEEVVELLLCLLCSRLASFYIHVGKHAADNKLQ